MIDTNTKIINQLLAQIHFDKDDRSSMKISFFNVLQIFAEHDIILPQKAYESTVQAVLDTRLVGKIRATDGAKYAIAQAMLNTAHTMSISKEDILKYKIRTNQE